MHEFYLTEIYLKNNLIRPGALTIAGEPIDLTLVHTPLYQVGAEDDHIAPWRQTFRINSQVTGSKRFVLSSSGHILGIVNPPVSPPQRRYQIGPAHRGQTADAWLATARAAPGQLVGRLVRLARRALRRPGTAARAGERRLPEALRGAGNLRPRALNRPNR